MGLVSLVSSLQIFVSKFWLDLCETLVLNVYGLRLALSLLVDGEPFLLDLSDCTVWTTPTLNICGYLSYFSLRVSTTIAINSAATGIIIHSLAHKCKTKLHL